MGADSNVINLLIAGIASAITGWWSGSRSASNRFADDLAALEKRIAELEREYVSSDELRDTIKSIDLKLDNGLVNINKRLDGVFRLISSRD